MKKYLPKRKTPLGMDERPSVRVATPPGVAQLITAPASETRLMTLPDLIAGVEDNRKTLTVFNADGETVATLRDHFADRNVRVVGERTESGRPGEFVTLSEDGDVLAAATLEDLAPVLAGDAVLGIDERPCRSLLARLDETLFTSWNRTELVAASREIEDRAFRVGSGQLHAGFQHTGTLANELPVYARLGSTAVEVHAYAVPDGEPPTCEDVRFHLDGAEEIARSWFVVFDGGDEDAACALLAEERFPGEFYGFWTYDGPTVGWVVDYLAETYGTRASATDR